MAKCFHIFLLGTPGVGKSEIFYPQLSEQIVKEGLAKETPRIDDFPKLWNIFQTDKKFKRCRRTADGGYKVTDQGVWDEILRDVNKDVLKMQDDNRVIFIEFSRANMVHSLTENFSREILTRSLVLYALCPFDVCWRRNVARHKAAKKEGGDDHLVPREEMESTYAKDDHDALFREPSLQTMRIDDRTGDYSKWEDDKARIMKRLRGILK